MCVYIYISIEMLRLLLCWIVLSPERPYLIFSGKDVTVYISIYADANCTPESMICSGLEMLRYVTQG